MRLSRASLVVIGGVALAAALGAGVEYAIDTRRAKADRAMKMTGGDPDKAPQLMRRFGCAGCHQIPGVPGASGRVGPPLAGLGRRVYVAGSLPNTPDNVVAFILQPRAHSPDSAMPVTGIDERGARDVAAYLFAH